MSKRATRIAELRLVLGLNRFTAVLQSPLSTIKLLRSSTDERGCYVSGKLFVGVGGCPECPTLAQPSVQAGLLARQKAAVAPDPDLEKATVNQPVNEWGHIPGLTQNKGRTTNRERSVQMC